MTVELELVPAQEVVDDTFFVDAQKTTIEQFLSCVDAPIEDARAGDFEAGFDTIRSMSTAGRAMGWALAKLIHSLYTEWVAQEREVERFWMRCHDDTTLKRITMERYIDAWNAHLGIPEQYARAMLNQPIKNAIQLGSAMAKGYDPDEEELEKLTKAGSFSEFSNILRGTIDRKPRAGALTLKIDMNTGDINAWMNEKCTYVGYLNVKEAKDNPALEKAIERILRSSGLIKE